MADSTEGTKAKDAEGRDDERDARDEQEEPERERSFRRLGDQLISNLIGDSSAAFKRGQGLVTGVAHGTKEELVRVISQEVRGFLDKMDAADLVQEIVSGLVIEMKTEIRFSRAEDGKVQSEINSGETTIRHKEDEPSSED